MDSFTAGFLALAAVAALTALHRLHHKVDQLGEKLDAANKRLRQLTGEDR